MNILPNSIFIGDNLPLLRKIDSNSIDLIYLDPPFNSKKQWSASPGSKAVDATFKDTWTLSDIDISDIERMTENDSELAVLINVIGNVNGKGKGNKSYLLMMALRLIEMHRILKDTGSIYLHCDPTMSHSLKLVMDSIFGLDNFRNEIIWHYGKMSNSSRNFPKNHDVILRYTKTDDFVFNPQKEVESEYRTRLRRFLLGNQVRYGSVKHKTDKLIHGRIRKIQKNLGRALEDSDILFDFDKEFKNQSDVIYASIVKGNSKERTGYPTQKPLALLKRIIKASTNPGDVVLDPFCGSGTTLLAAHEYNRLWIGIDISEKALELAHMRFENESGLHTWSGNHSQNQHT